ncbi:histidine kinase [Solitalea longa]|uniref:Histidine kinase n=1 Tax=Solitalea longa TaxID=2079460 RepID=A0A2S5A1S4_9SPHI|nr:histidine kinase [Solitalea longa]POY36531.1 histidine kinase [Solitalea longa]
MREFKNIRTVIFHILAWVGVFIIPEFFRPDSPAIPSRIFSFQHFLTFNLPLVVFFYLNAYYLIPRIMRKKPLYAYVLSVIGIMAAILLFNQLLRMEMPPPQRMLPLREGRGIGMGAGGGMRLFLLFPLLFIWATSTSYRFIIDQLKADRQNKERENIHLKTELSFLRSQISPHFIFNILNSLVALSRKRPEQVEPAIIQLSQMIRYMLYENDELKVSIEKEIEYLQNYIDLQRLRFGDSVQVIFTVINETTGKSIEPMLLIPFIENAFKHGVGLIEKPVIEIHLHADDKDFWFTVTNKFNDADPKDESSGIGLVNVERRLKILYNNHHHLRLMKDDEYFKVELSIELQ